MKFSSLRSTQHVKKLEYDRLAVVILDGCTYHASDFFLDESTHTSTVSLFLPAHSNDQNQPLDFGLFHIEKTEAL
jgi:hypothetical protein